LIAFIIWRLSTTVALELPVTGDATVDVCCIAAYGPGLSSSVIFIIFFFDAGFEIPVDSGITVPT